jgi:hypothetical protein
MLEGGDETLQLSGGGAMTWLLVNCHGSASTVRSLLVALLRMPGRQPHYLLAHATLDALFDPLLQLLQLGA